LFDDGIPCGNLASFTPHEEDGLILRGYPITDAAASTATAVTTILVACACLSVAVAIDVTSAAAIFKGGGAAATAAAAFALDLTATITAFAVIAAHCAAAALDNILTPGAAALSTIRS